MAHPIDNLPPIHPGSFLRDELATLDLSARKFADHIHVPHNAVTERLRTGGSAWSFHDAVISHVKTAHA